MIKIIKKRHVPETTRAPAPIKTEAPPPAPRATPAYTPPPPPKPVAQLPMAPTKAAYMKNPTAYRAPTMAACTFCKHSYGFPCHGADDACMNRKFIADRDAVATA